MIENLINLVKEHASEVIIKNPAIPNEKNEDAIAHTASGIMDALKNQVTNGGISSVAGLFSGGNVAENPMVGTIVNSVAGGLMSKFGLNQNAANGVVSSMIPSVMNNLVKKVNDPNDSSFDIASVLKSVGGADVDVSSVLGKLSNNTSGGIGGMITNFFK